MPGSLGRHVVDRLQTSAYQVVEEEVLPAFRRLQDFLQYEYRLDDIIVRDYQLSPVSQHQVQITARHLIHPRRC